MTMSIDILIVITAAGALVAGMLIAWLIMRAQVARTRQEGDREIDRWTSAVDEKDVAIRALEDRLSESTAAERRLEGDLRDLEKRLAVVEHDNQTIPGLNEQLTERS